MQAMGRLKPFLRAASLAALTFCSPASDAALVDCRPPEKARFVVFLSEPEFTQAAFSKREEMLGVFNRLQEHLDQRRDLEMAGIESVEFRVARCEKRVPAIDGQEFTGDVVRSLYSRNVVVEIWGRLDAKRQPGNRVDPSAQMNYLLVPIKHGSVAGSERVPGIHRFNYPDREIVATDFVDLVSNADLHAFVTTGIGVMAFDGEDFALAHEMLCKASGQLARTKQRLSANPSTKAQGESIQQLRAFVGDLAGRAIVEARKKPKPVPPFAQLRTTAEWALVGVRESRGRGGGQSCV